MGTKNKPGEFDCYENAHPDEPMFILLARDPLAPDLVRRWADEYEDYKAETVERLSPQWERVRAKAAEARACADAMREWRTVAECEEGSAATDDRPTSRRRQKVKAWRDLLKQKLSIAGVTPFYMVAAVPDGQHAYSEEQEREFQPQKRHLNHKSALAMAWHMCRKFTKPFVVLGVCGIALPVLPDKTERDDEAEPAT